MRGETSGTNNAAETGGIDRGDHANNDRRSGETDVLNRRIGARAESLAGIFPAQATAAPRNHGWSHNHCRR